MASRNSRKWCVSDHCEDGSHGVLTEFATQQNRRGEVWTSYAVEPGLLVARQLERSVSTTGVEEGYAVPLWLRLARGAGASAVAVERAGRAS